MNCKKIEKPPLRMVTNISIKYIIYRNSEKIYSHFLDREANIDFASKNSKVI